MQHYKHEKGSAHYIVQLSYRHFEYDVCEIYLLSIWVRKMDSILLSNSNNISLFWFHVFPQYRIKVFGYQAVGPSNHWTLLNTSSQYEAFFFGKYCNFVLNGKKKKPMTILGYMPLNHSNHYMCHILVRDTLLIYSSLFMLSNQYPKDMTVLKGREELINKYLYHPKQGLNQGLWI